MTARLLSVARKRYRLVLARVKERSVRSSDLHALAERVVRLAPDIDVALAGKRSSGQWRLLPHAFQPTLTVGFGELRRRRFLNGRILHCPRMPKQVELEGLRGAGIPVPDWVVIEPGTSLDPGVWGPYVVVKPSVGGAGIDVRIRRTGRVRYEAPEALATAPATRRSPMLAQRFVYTGPWAVSYRVCSFFGRALYCWRVVQSHAKRPLAGRWAFAGGADGGGIQIIAPSKTSTYTLDADAAVIELAERAHRLAFPDYPYLGFDLLRDAESGELSVIEANSGGGVWHLSSTVGISMQRDHAIDLYRQFDALGRAARAAGRDHPQPCHRGAGRQAPAALAPPLTPSPPRVTRLPPCPPPP